MRLFVAAQLPEQMLDALAETSSLLRGCIRGRYVAPDSFHVTLAFLGDVDSSRIDAAARALETACLGMEAFTTSLGDLGKFGRPSSATLWQGFLKRDEFCTLAKAVRSSLNEAGFSFDAKSFLPHVTLMRAANLKSGVLPSPTIASGAIDTATLFRSDLSGPRPRYEALHTVTLVNDHNFACD